MADQKIVSEEALTAIASDIKTAIGAKADSSNVYTKSEANALLAEKANTEGEYDALTAGNAKQLVATVGETDRTPYLFRTSGGALDIGDRETDELVGGSVAFNQYYNPSFVSDTEHNGIKFEKQNDGSIRVYGTFTGMNLAYVALLFTERISAQVGHKYYVTTNLQNGHSKVWYNQDNPAWKLAEGIGNVHTIANGFYIISEGKIGEAIDEVVKPQIIDLTAMFGSTIADYIYSLEQATTGAGVAWFKRLFNKPYYAYNAGELMSVKTSGHKLVGFNAWDEETEIGGINTDTGLNIADNTRLRTKNYIPVVAGMAYYFSTQTSGENYYINPVFYDADKNYIGFLRYGSYSPKSTNMAEFNNPFNIPENACFMRFAISQSYGTTYKNDICINISDSNKNGQYEPYIEHNYALDDVELRGLFKLDSNNKLYADGDTYESSGDVERKFNKTTLDSNTQWTWDSKNGVAYTQIADAISVDPTSQLRVTTLNSSGKFYDVSWGGRAWYDNTIGSYFGRPRIFIKSTDFSSAADVNAYFASNSIELLYEKATPTTETADTFTNPQIVNDFGTEEYIDNRAVPIPVGHNTFYEVNLRAKLEMSPDSPESNGDYLMRHTSEGNAYTPYVSPIPALPSTDGTYTLKCTVSGSTKTLTWVEET